MSFFPIHPLININNGKIPIDLKIYFRFSNRNCYLKIVQQRSEVTLENIFLLWENHWNCNETGPGFTMTRGFVN